MIANLLIDLGAASADTRSLVGSIVDNAPGIFQAGVNADGSRGYARQEPGRAFRLSNNRKIEGD